MLFTIGVVGVCILAGVKFLLDSYYLDMTETYEKTLLPANEQLDQVRAHDTAQLEKGERGNIPVSVAMQTLAAKGRDNASTLITPQPSDDVDPLKGWAKLKREVHLPPQVTTTTAPEPPPPMMMGDAGAPANAPKDGGAAPHAVPHLDATKDGGK